jgi:putative membrane protein
VSSPDPNTATLLAIERTRVAYERTMMAWVRTGTSLIAFGFSVYKFFQLGAPAVAAARSPIGPREFAMGLLVLGLLSLVLGTVEHARDLRSLRKLHPDMPRSLSGLVAIVMASIGLASLVAVVLNA